MTKGKKLIEALDKAYDMEIVDTTLNFDNEFKVAPQVGAGKSVWAPWVRNEDIKPYECLWAFRDTNPKQWLAVRIEIPFKEFTFSKQPEAESPSHGTTFYFNLQNSEDRWRLKQLETELATYLNSSQ